MREARQTSGGRQRSAAVLFGALIVVMLLGVGGFVALFLPVVAHVGGFGLAVAFAASGCFLILFVGALALPLRRSQGEVGQPDQQGWLALLDRDAAAGPAPSTLGARLVIAVLLALIFAVGATLLGRQISSPSIMDCSSGTCVTEYRSFGWPIPWKTEVPASEVDDLLPFQAGPPLGINSAGVSLSAVGMTVGLWFLAAFGALMLLDTVLGGRWRYAGGPHRAFIAIVLALGLAAGATILGALVTNTGVFHSTPYESAGWPIEWKTSPRLLPEPETVGLYEELQVVLRPFNLLGFSPIWLAAAYVVWVTISASGVAAVIFAASLRPSATPARSQPETV